MEGFSDKKSKPIEIDINRISSLKRVSDLFPKGLIGGTGLKNLPSNVTRVGSESLLVKDIPNLVSTNQITPLVPKNSIATQAEEQNATLVNVTKSQFQNTFIKRIKPLNIVTILLFVGWMITITLLMIF